MPIKYEKLLKMLEDKGYTTYRLRKEGIIGNETFRKLKQGGHVDTRIIERFCALLNCQPGDIMEYVADEQESAND